MKFTINIPLSCLRAQHGKSEGNSISLNGPFTSLASFKEGTTHKPVSFSFKEVKKWNDSVSLPLLPRADSTHVFAQLRKSPWLDLNEGDQWRARPDAELHSRNQKYLMDLKSEGLSQGVLASLQGSIFQSLDARYGDLLCLG